jgi:Uma2 family endonuclease
MATTATMSGAAFDQLPYEKDRKQELIEGELIEVPSPTPEHQLCVITLGGSLDAYFRREQTGVVLPDSEFALGDYNRLRPDLAILLNERWAKVDRKKSPIRLAPDIAIEVLSPSELANRSLRKVWIYLEAGVKEVWQVSAESQKVLIYKDSKSATILDIGDRLSTPLLPGWDLPVRDLFER